MRKLFLSLLLIAIFTSASANEFKFVVYADVQRQGEGNHSKLAGIISRIPGGATFAIECGDMAGLGNSTVATATTWDDHLATALKLGIPFWPCRGNHDGVEDKDGVTIENWKNSMAFIRERAEYKSGSPNNDYYSFMYNNCLFVVINNMNGNKEPQMKWIAEEVKSDHAKNAAHIFVFNHYPVLGPNKSEAERANRRWKKYIEPYFEKMPNFSGIFWGDRHWFWKGTYKGITGVLVPPTTVPRTNEKTAGPDELSGTFSGYLVIHVKDNVVTGKAYDYTEAEQASFTMKEANSNNPQE